MADVLRATYADLKTVKTRSTCQLILELPIEALTDVVALLGAPVPGNEVWVAVARLRPEAAAAPAIEHHNDDGPEKPPRPLSQIAAMLCGVGAFQQFIREESDGWDHRPSTDEAAEWLRANCGIKSRTELNTNPVAAQRFREIRSGYDAWMRVPA